MARGIIRTCVLHMEAASSYRHLSGRRARAREFQVKVKVCRELMTYRVRQHRRWALAMELVSELVNMASKQTPGPFQIRAMRASLVYTDAFLWREGIGTFLNASRHGICKKTP